MNTIIRITLPALCIFAMSAALYAQAAEDDSTASLRQLPITALDRGIYVAFAVVGAMPLFLLVASIMGTSVAAARRTVMTFLAGWIRVAPPAVRKQAKAVLGIGGAFLFLLLFAFICDQFAKTILPSVVHRLGAGYCLAAFSEHDSIEVFENAFRSQWTLERGENIVSGPGLSRFKWEHGRTGARFWRAFVAYGFVLVLAAGFDLSNKRQVGRGRALLVLGVLAVVLFATIWSRQEANYIRYMLQQNCNLQSRVLMPSVPCEMPCPP